MSFRNREIYLIYKTDFIKPFLLSIELSFALSLHEEDRNELYAVLQKYRCYVSVQILQSWQCYTCMDVDIVLDTLLWQLPVLTSCCWEWVSLLYSDVQKATLSNSSFYEPLFSISGGKVFLFHYCVWLESKECTVETHDLNTEGEGNDLSLWNACKMFPVSWILNISQLRNIFPGLQEDASDKEKWKTSCSSFLFTMQIIHTLRGYWQPWHLDFCLLQPEGI